MATEAEAAGASSGPTPGVKYPLKVEYCPKCSMPFEYCEYYPGYEECKRWLAENMPDKFSALSLEAPGGDEKVEGSEAGAAAGEQEGKKRQTRGGKGMVKAKKKDKEVEKRITLFIAPRGKRKSVTVVQGLKTFGKIQGCSTVLLCHYKWYFV